MLKWECEMANWRVLGCGVVLVSILAMSACSQRQAAVSDFMSESNVVKAEKTAVVGSDSAPAADVSQAVSALSTPGESLPTDPAPPATGAPTTTTALLLAYSYTATFSLPSANVTSSMKAHEQKCITAGPAVCQVVTAASQKQGDEITANLTLRATPTWLGTFRSGLEQDAKKADGKLEAEGVTSEDLTRSITDSEARLRALKSLRTRIEALIASRPGKLSDLLEAERELARVQGEIDSFESNLSVMRARVNMSTMELVYQSRALAVGGGTFSPLGNALTGFFGVMAGSLAALITFLAAILPFVLVIGPIVYYGLRWRAARVQARVKRAPDIVAPS
jgi:Domain of unknown function (DUF4349)